MAAINLGNVVGLLKSATAPTKKYIIWAKPVGTADPNECFLFRYNYISESWEPFDLSDGYALPAVKGVPNNSPPVSPTQNYYLTGPAATGAWTGHNNQLAVYTGTGWAFQAVKEGAVANDLLDVSKSYQFTNAGWVAKTNGPIQAVEVLQVLTISSNGQTVFTLSQAPTSPSISKVTLNGIMYDYLVDYTISGTTLTWTSSIALETSDKLKIYIK